MTTFIGEDLTMQLLREVWPNASLEDLPAVEGIKNDQTN